MNTEMSLDPQYQRQLELEAEMVGLGAERYTSRVNKELEAGRFSNTETGTYLLKKIIDPFSQAISEFIEETKAGKPGPKARAAVLLTQYDIDSQTAAYLTARAVLNSVATRVDKDFGYTTVTRASTSIARAIELEMRFSKFQSEHPHLYRTINHDLSRNMANENRRALVLTYAMGKYKIDFSPLSQSDGILLGSKLLDILQESTGLIEIKSIRLPVKRGKVNKDAWVVSLAPQISQWVGQSLLKGQELRPIFLPTLIPPRAWTSLDDGGYHSDVFAQRPSLVRTRSKLHRHLLERANLGSVLEAVNLIQSTPWQINLQVLNLLTNLVSAGGNGPGLIKAVDEPLPPRPVDIDTNPHALREWKWRARDVHRDNAVRRAECINQRSLIEIAQRFASEPQIYFPHSLDFRGRVYPLPLVLHPQGSDLVKSLLRFSEGKPLGDEGYFWWRIHGANLYGVDKVSFQERTKWVSEHHEAILRCAKDPVDSRDFWGLADKPWQFLAWCFEYKEWTENPGEFLSHLPVALDGSCNGLQHFSALLSDKVGGQATNLINAEKPQDIYQTVCDRVTELLRRDYLNLADIDPAKSRYAHGWSVFPLDRKITKRPVMVLPYGGTPRSCLKYVEQAVQEKLSAGVEHNFGDELPAAIAYLSSVVWEAIGDTVISARDAMDWIQKVARVFAKANSGVHWTTPSGFVVYQGALKTIDRRVKTQISGSIVRLRTPHEVDKVDPAKQATSISPNFVHSLDAAALVQTVCNLRQCGITNLAMVHDSYGTHACDVGELSYQIRKAFVEMYETDPLTHFRDEILGQLPMVRRRNQKKLPVQADIPNLPQKGGLDLQQVMDAQFFFA